MKNPNNAVSAHLMAQNKTLPSNIINHSALTGAFHQPLLKNTRNNKRLQQRFRFSSTALSVCIAFAGLNLIPTLFTPLRAEPSGGVIVGGTGSISRHLLHGFVQVNCGPRCLPPTP